MNGSAEDELAQVLMARAGADESAAEAVAWARAEGVLELLATLLPVELPTDALSAIAFDPSWDAGDGLR